MKTSFKYLVSIALTLALSTTVAFAQIYAEQVQPESCDPGNDGIAEVFFPEGQAQYFDVLWTYPGGNTSTSPRITGLQKGNYHVKVTAKPCPDKIIYQAYIGIYKERGCGDLDIDILGASYAESCEIPSVTLTASAYGGTPPYRYSWPNRTKKLTGDGYYLVSCTVTDSLGETATAYKSVYLQKLECSQDPNEITGPAGYNDSIRFVSTKDKMNYTIGFENDPDFATAPATRVSITYPVPANQNISSFRLSDFGFGSFVFTVPSNSTSYSRRLDVSDSLGVWVDVTAGIDIQNNQLYWIFQSIDPTTGFEPASSQMGFLPVNDSLGRGEGYVSFLIAPKSGLHTGDTTVVDATIVFDDNPPIPTNKWLNTFDAVAPTSTLHASVSALDSTVCTFSFTANDDNGGCGVNNVELYVSQDEGEYILYSSAPVDSTLTYTLQDGINYRFVSLAVDNVGNRETMKSSADTAINNNNAPTDILISTNTFYENAAIGTTVGLLASLDNDITQPFTYELVSGDGSADNALFAINGGQLVTNSVFSCNGRYVYNVRIRTTDISGLSFEKSFELQEIQQNFTKTTTLQRSVCQGDYVEFGNSNYSVAGVYTDSLLTTLGCDSIVTMNLQVHPVYSMTDVVVACDSSEWNGTTYTSSISTPQKNLYTIQGCDSIITLNLTVNYSNSGIETADVCDSYTWNGTTYTASNNTATQTSTNAAGCDSVTTLNLTIRNSSTAQETYDVCDSYTWHGTVYTASTNSATYSTTNAVGCDSTITLNLTIRNSSAATEVLAACDSMTWHGTTYTASTTTPTYSTINTVGCDSVTTLNLTINQSNSGIETISACDSYIWHGTTYTASNSTATFTSLNAAGCDSVTTLNLTVNVSTTSTESQTACDSYTWHGTTYTTSTSSATYTTTNAAGCDSVITLTLTINPSSTAIETITACDSYIWHGTSYTASTTTPTYSTTNAAGCDSTVTLHLTINTSDNTVESINACDSYTWHGTTYNASNNTATYSTTNAAGCDSIVTLNLTINLSNSGTETLAACDSMTWHGVTYTSSTDTPTFTETNVAGCDSVVTLNLTINMSSSATVTQSACDSYEWQGNTYTVSTTETVTIANAAGCDSVMTLVLTINYSVETYDTLTLETNQLPYDYYGNTINAAGDYTFTGATAAGCDSTMHVHVKVLEGIDVAETLNNVKIHPNPTHGKVTIDADNVVKVEVLDAVGRLVKTIERDNTVDLSSLGAGAYNLRITLTNGVTIRKVVKK